jgi:MoxR-vWA-beta-propeller ternary system domain bpX2
MEVTMTASWKDARRASLPVEDLPVLARLRCQGEFRVLIKERVAWLSWEQESDGALDMVVRLILPLVGAGLYVERGGHWYRIGEHLPVFDVPRGDLADWVPIDRAIFPEPVEGVQAERDPEAPMPLRLVRDAVLPARLASGLRCSLSGLRFWAERATSAQLAALSGAWIGQGLTEGSEAQVFLTGSSESLPLLPEGVRYWGTDLLVPLGFRVEPNLAAAAIRRAIGARHDELAVIDQDGIELIPRTVLARLSRASIRMIDEGRHPATEASA